MTNSIGIDLMTNREYLVVKDNMLIQSSRFELSLPEQKAVAYICSLIKPSKNSPETLELEYEFNIRDYCKICGIDYMGGKNYKDIKNTLKKLADRSMWLDTDNAEVLMRWLSYVKVSKKSETVHIEIDRTIAPYLFNLQKKFTQYQLYNILAMKSAFSIRLYELMKSYSFQKKKTFELDNLKHILMVDNVKSYDRFPDFRRKVLEQALKEINTLTDLNVTYETVTKGRKVIQVTFRIKQTTPVEQLICKTNTLNAIRK